jgi:hypothetical protein
MTPQKLLFFGSKTLIRKKVLLLIFFSFGTISLVLRAFFVLMTLPWTLHGKNGWGRKAVTKSG